MPVLPLVGSMSTVSPGLILPALSAASIIAKPMRSFTLLTGFWLSSLATTVAGSPAAMRLSRTSGVRPMSSVTSAAMRAMIFSFFRAKGPYPRLQCRPHKIGEVHQAFVNVLVQLLTRSAQDAVPVLHSQCRARQAVVLGNRDVDHFVGVQKGP